MWTALIVAPYFCSFTAISANIDISPALQYATSKVYVLRIVPYLFERLSFQITELVLGIFVETAGYHEAVPGDDGCMPEPPAMVVE